MKRIIALFLIFLLCWTMALPAAADIWIPPDETEEQTTEKQESASQQLNEADHPADTPLSPFVTTLLIILVVLIVGGGIIVFTLLYRKKRET